MKELKHAGAHCSSFTVCSEKKKYSRLNKSVFKILESTTCLSLLICKVVSLKTVFDWLLN